MSRFDLSENGPITTPEDTYPRVADPLASVVSLPLRDFLAMLGESATLAIIDADKRNRIARAVEREAFRAEARERAVKRAGREGK